MRDGTGMDRRTLRKGAALTAASMVPDDVTMAGHVERGDLPGLTSAYQALA